MSELTTTVATILASIGVLAGHAQAATPHPLTVGLRVVELACAAQGGEEPVRRQFEAAYCSEMSALLGRKLGVSVESVDEAGPAPLQSLPRAGVVWVRSVVELTAEAVTARAAWGSYAPQGGVPASEEGGPVGQPLDAATVEASGRALAATMIGQMPFVPNS